MRARARAPRRYPTGSGSRIPPSLIGHAAELKVLAANLPDGRSRTDAALELLWQCFSGTFFQVAMELRTAARTDPELRPVLVAAERSLRDRIVAQRVSCSAKMSRITPASSARSISRSSS